MPKSKSLRIIIDTNLWISFLISKKLLRLDTLIFSGKITLLFSNELANEIHQAITKPKLKKYFGDNALEEMLLAFEDYIDLIHVTSKINICRDYKDNFLLALAKDGNAGYLLTGDKDLLVLEKFNTTRIVTFSEFLKKYT